MTHPDHCQCQECAKERVQFKRRLRRTLDAPDPIGHVTLDADQVAFVRKLLKVTPWAE